MRPAVPAAEVSASPPTPQVAQPAAPIEGDGTPEGDARLVYEAAHALRNAHDPSRAAPLLDQYLERHPDGPVAEEALELAIECAAAKGDARAAELAGRYLTRYPSGRWAPLARRVLDRFDQ
jgi:TolA-binding protein